MTPFNIFAGNPTGDTTLTSALLAPGGSGIAIVASSIKLQASGQDAVNFYDGSLAPLGIGAGLLLTAGITPGTSNTVGWFGTDNSGASGFTNGDADIDAVVNTVGLNIKCSLCGDHQGLPCRCYRNPPMSHDVGPTKWYALDPNAAARSITRLRDIAGPLFPDSRLQCVARVAIRRAPLLYMPAA